MDLLCNYHHCQPKIKSINQYEENCQEKLGVLLEESECLWVEFPHHSVTGLPPSSRAMGGPEREAASSSWGQENASVLWVHAGPSVSVAHFSMTPGKKRGIIAKCFLLMFLARN